VAGAHCAQAGFGYFIGAGEIQDAPCGACSFRNSQYSINLCAVRECASVEEDESGLSMLRHVCGSFEHGPHAQVILFGGVVCHLTGKERGAYAIFIQYCGIFQMCDQRLRQRAFTCRWKSRQKYPGRRHASMVAKPPWMACIHVIDHVAFSLVPAAMRATQV
jgi:hypothetical protein